MAPHDARAPALEPVMNLFLGKEPSRLLISWPSSRVITLDYPSGSSVITVSSELEKGRRRASELCNVRRTQSAVAGVEGGERGHEPRGSGSF